ncbi:MAG: shikimate dehydrogenase [Terrimicrobiaceae bacterium]|nr:shikimate dehydrogenase [Terrimicrobiaceae bacterium]
MSEVHAAADLLDGAPVLRGLTPPARLAVLGDPVEHSKSPAFHNAALRAAGIDAQYVKILVRPEELSGTLRALPAAGFLGVNVTLPHKAAALATVDEADDYAKKSGAVNTVLVDDDALRGFNTDGPGFLRAIREDFSADLRDLRILILGAGGGAGRAIAVQCALERCERLVLVNRTVEKARALAAELAPCFRSDRLLGPAERLAAIPHEDEALRAELAHVDLVVNATSLGMKRSDPPLLPQSHLTPNLMVYDAIYTGGKTRLIEDAEQAGARAANGLSMLLHQGALSFEIWFNRPAPLAVMRAALLAA